VSEYFRNALNLGSNLALETPSSASELKPIRDKDLKDKLNDDSFPKDEESVYHGHWRFLVSLFFGRESNHISRGLIKMRYRTHGLPAHVSALLVSLSACSIP
jgi:hypothetical protein